MPTNPTPGTRNGYFLIGLGIVVATIVAVWFFRSGTPPVPTPPPANSSGAAVAPGPKSECDGLAGEQKTACEKRTATGDKLSDLVVEAGKSQDPKQCDALQEWNRDTCKDFVQFEIAMANRNRKDCEPIKNKAKLAVCQQRMGSGVTIPPPPKK